MVDREADAPADEDAVPQGHITPGFLMLRGSGGARAPAVTLEERAEAEAVAAESLAELMALEMQRLARLAAAVPP